MNPDDGIFRKILACSVCKTKLSDSAFIHQDGVWKCEHCENEFNIRDGIFDFIPHPIPDKKVSDNLDLWNQLQKNGHISYEAAPELNLSVGLRKDAIAFNDFCGFTNDSSDGMVLDIGCGPQEIPSYFKSLKGILVGVDPLIGVQPKKFLFVKAIGEYLPFCDQVFDKVILSSCIDHMLNPQLALSEVKRVLKREGIVKVWIDCVDQEKKTKIWRKRIEKVYGLVLRENFLTLLKNFFGVIKIFSTKEFSRPAAAIDHFHFYRIDEAWVREQLSGAGLKIKSIIHHPDAFGFFVDASAFTEPLLEKEGLYAEN